MVSQVASQVLVRRHQDHPTQNTVLITNNMDLRWLFRLPQSQKEIQTDSPQQSQHKISLFSVFQCVVIISDEYNRMVEPCFGKILDRGGSVLNKAASLYLLEATEKNHEKFPQGGVSAAYVTCHLPPSS